MSKWTGKSDFADWCLMHNSPQEIVDKATVYLGNAKVAINSTHDLIPYYTNLISSASGGKSEQTIQLTAKSFIDIEETRFMSTKVYQVIKWKRKADKGKQKFDYSFIRKQKDFWLGEINLWEKLIDTVNKKPEIAKFHLNKDYEKALTFIESWIIPQYFNDVHDALHTRMREEFVKYCSENGYCAFSWNFETGEVGYQNQGDWHPIIRKMCFDIADFHKMERGV